MRKPTIWVPTRSNTNRAVQSQKMVLDLESRGIVLSKLGKIKALISFAVTVKLICAFVSPMQIVGFHMWRLIFECVKLPLVMLKYV